VKVIVGLGNPGPRYAATRHNVGFRVVEELAARLGAETARELCGSLASEAGDLLLVRPQTFMNRSGFTVRCLADRFGLAPGDFLIVFDDVALPLGALRLRGKGSPGGHRGLESVLESLGADEVPRLRLGVAGPSLPPPGEGLADYVLAPFEAGEEAEAAAMIGRSAEACLAWASDGVEKAASRFNGLRSPELDG
jgi:PTH1 family peptidyl-tRNA hydrolase